MLRDRWFWLTLALCAGIYACTLTYPFNNDNALYAYMGELLLHGHAPYTGSWDQNFPGIILVHAIQILLTGRSQLAFHLFDILLQLSGCILAIRVGEIVYERRAGCLAAILLALYYLQQGLWMAGERDTYVSILLLLMILRSRGKSHAFEVGVLCGLAILFRPTYAGFAAVLAVWYGTSSFRNALICVSGTAVPILLVILLYAVGGGLQDLWQATVLFNVKIYSGTGVAFSLWEPVRFYVASFIAAIVGVWAIRQSRTLPLLLGLVAMAILSLIVLYRHSVYHYHPAMTIVLLLSAVGWTYLSDKASRSVRAAPLLFPALVVLFFVFQTFRGNTIQQVLRDLVAGRITQLDQAYHYYESSPEFGVSVQQQVAAYLQDHTVAGEPVQIFGPYSYPQYAAGLGTASRFQTLHALTMRGQDASLQPFQLRWRAEYLRDMTLRSPKYFIVCDAPDAFRQYYGGRLGHEILEQDWTELNVWLRAHYFAETKIGAFTLYRRL